MHLRTWHVLALVGVVSFVLTLAAIPRDTWIGTAALSLGSGVAAAAAMGVAALLGGRWKLVESAFGGLDRVYRVHKWLGITALAFASVHLLFKAGVDGWDTAAMVALPGGATRFVRQLSFVSLMLVVMLALNRNIPYSTWRWLHKASGPLFLVVVAHWLSIKSPIALTDPAGVWLAAVSGLGVAAAAYKMLLYPFLSSHAEYRVEAVSRGQGAVHLELSPVGRGIPFAPGQFAFLHLKEDGLREPHPFTIASGGGPDGRVHFVIRALGDYTEQLVARTREGMLADVYLPFGRFRRPTAAAREIWIGGGVGISPFLAWMSAPQAAGLDRVTLFYFFTPGREFPSVDALTNMGQETGVTVVPCAAGPSDPAFRDRLGEVIRAAGPDAVQVRFCGPKGLLAVIRSLLREHGVSETRLVHELFDFR